MPNQKVCPDQDFIRLFESIGPTKAAKQLGVTLRKVFERRRVLEKTYGPITPPKNPQPVEFVEHPQRACYDIYNGHVIVGSDFHFWPNHISTAFKFFIQTIKDLKPKIIVLNGDVLDGASISRWPRMNWEHVPSLAQEIQVVDERLEEIRSVSKNAKLVWTLGNHCARFETKLANTVPEFEGVQGIHLKDHFPHWRPAWACWINNSVVIKHRFKGGTHAPHNNALWARKTIVTGHLHSHKIQPIPSYDGIIWGVDTGCMADPYGPQFNSYTEDSPVPWASGFGVLTFNKGNLLPPELATVMEGTEGWSPGDVVFRGQVFNVK
jgi:hypothetical protein